MAPPGERRWNCAFELQLVERVDLLGDVHVVAVRDVALVRDARDDAEAALEGTSRTCTSWIRAACRTARSRCWCAAFHSAHLSFMCCMTSRANGVAARVGVAVARHVLDALVQAGVAEARWWSSRRTAACRWARPSSRRASAPYCHRMGAASDSVPFRRLWRHISARVAQLQALVEDLPELVHVAAGGQRHVRQVDA